jgi:hypothetical protein
MPVDEGYRKQVTMLIKTVPLVAAETAISMPCLPRRSCQKLAFNCNIVGMSDRRLARRYLLGVAALYMPRRNGSLEKTQCVTLSRTILFSRWLNQLR